MKRLTALLLIFSMLIPMVGCSVSEEDLKDQAEDAVKDAVGDVIDDAVGDIEDNLNQKKDELEDSLDQVLPELPNTGTNESLGLGGDWCDHEIVKYDEKNKTLTCKCGYKESKEHVGFEEFKTYVPKYGFVHSVLGFFKLGPSKAEYYAIKYAAYCGACVCELNLGVDPYVYNENIHAIECQCCSSQYPVSDLKFSEFLEYFYHEKELAGLSREEKLTDLNEKEKTKALDAYVQTKVLMTAQQVQNLETYKDLWNQEKELNAIQYAALFTGATNEILEKIQLQDSESLFLLSTYLPAAFSDVGIDVSFFDAMDTAGIVISFTELLGATGDAQKAEEHYEELKKAGKEYTKAMVDAHTTRAIANAKMLIAFAGFLSNCYGFSVGAPSPDTDAILEDIEKLTKEYTLGQLYDVLSRTPVSELRSSNYTINEILYSECGIKGRVKDQEDTPFIWVYSDNIEELTSALENGPSAKEIVKAIPHVITRTDEREPNLQKAVSSALWYYYGWRVEYDYKVFCDQIYADEI